MANRKPEYGIRDSRALSRALKRTGLVLIRRGVYALGAAVTPSPEVEALDKLLAVSAESPHPEGDSPSKLTRLRGICRRSYSPLGGRSIHLSPSAPSRKSHKATANENQGGGTATCVALTIWITPESQQVADLLGQ